MSEISKEDIPGLVQPEDRDVLVWYRIQTFGKWYAVRACCRRCATERLHGWTFQYPDKPSLLGEVKTVEAPEWLIRLKDD